MVRRRVDEGKLSWPFSAGEVEPGESREGIVVREIEGETGQGDPRSCRLTARFGALTMLTTARCARDGCATPVVHGRGEGVAKPVRAAVGNVWVKCTFCQGDLFRDREVKLNSSGMEFMNFGWANESATGLICWSCGYVHLFVNRDLELYKVKKSKG